MIGDVRRAQARQAQALQADITLRRAQGFELDVSVALEPGERLAVMGPSGAGKSTLLAVLAGFQRLDAGTVRLGNRLLAASESRINLPPMHRGIALLSQDPRLFPHLSARENVAFGLRARGLARAEAAETARQWLARVGLADAESTRPAELSGGQQQRVALARALATAPELVLLDEPLTSLDVEIARGIRELLAAELRGTSIIVTHDVLDALALADRLAIVEHGRMTQVEAVRDVLREPATAFAAALAGVSRVSGRVEDGVWVAGAMRMPLPGRAGNLLGIIRPDRVRLVGVAGVPTPGARHASASDLMRWSSTVTRIEQIVGAVRLHLDAPALAVDVPLDDFAETPMSPGADVELALAPDDIRFVAV